MVAGRAARHYRQNGRADPVAETISCDHSLLRRVVSAPCLRLEEHNFCANWRRAGASAYEFVARPYSGGH